MSGRGLGELHQGAEELAGDVHPAEDLGEVLERHQAPPASSRTRWSGSSCSTCSAEASASSTRALPAGEPGL